MNFGTGNGFEELFGEAFDKVTNGYETTVYENVLDKNSMLYIRRPSGKFYDAFDNLVEDQDRLSFLVDDGILAETSYTEEQVLNNFKYVITNGYDVFNSSGKTPLEESAIWANRNFAYNEYFFESKEDARRAINLNNWSETGVYVQKMMVKVD